MLCRATKVKINKNKVFWNGFKQNIAYKGMEIRFLIRNKPYFFIFFNLSSQGSSFETNLIYLIFENKYLK